MQILLINLADSEVSGKKSKAALEKKYLSSQIVLLNLLDAAKEWRKSPASFDWSLYEDRIKEAALNDNYSKIVICSHGKIDDIDNCYYEEFDGDEELTFLMSFSHLADALLVVLEKINFFYSINPINITLSICYAGRTDEHEKNHLNNPSLEFRNTFAANFTSELARKRENITIVVEAYIGAVGFNENTGEIEVETEYQIKEAIEIIEMRRRFNLITERIAELEIKNENDEELNSLVEQCDALEKQLTDKQISHSKKMVNYGKITYTKTPSSELTIDSSNLSPENYNQQSEDNESCSCVIFSPKRS